MRSLICLVALLALAALSGAGTVNLPAIATDPTTQDQALKDQIKWINGNTCQRLGLASTCSDAEAKVVEPTATIWPSTIAGYEAYSTWRLTNEIGDDVAQAKDRKAARDVAKAYKAATPSVQAQVDALLGTQ